jgi:hypothetical protein
MGQGGQVREDHADLKPSRLLETQAMPILRSLLLLIALLSPAFAQDGPQSAVGAKDAVRALQLYLDDVAKVGSRPDYTKPPASDLFQRVFDLAQLTTFPPPTAADVGWLIQWFTAASQANKLIIYFDARPGPNPDEMAVLRNLKEHENQYASAMNFMIRVAAREATALSLFMEQLTPEQRTPVREAGLLNARSGAAELLASSIGMVAQGIGPDNARLMSAALKDTRDVWAAYILRDDRTQIISYLTKAIGMVTDDEVKANLVAVADTITAAK